MAEAIEEIKRAISSGFSEAQSAVTRHTSEVVSGELRGFTEDVKKFTGSAFNVAKSVTKSAFGRKDKTEDLDEDRNEFLGNIEKTMKDDPVKGGDLYGVLAEIKNIIMQFTGYSEEQVKANEENNKVLDKIYDQQVDAEKAKLREVQTKDPKRSPWYMILFAIGLVVGAIAGAILLPFRLLLGALKLITPIAKGLSKIGKWIGSLKIFSYLDNFFKIILTKIPVVSGLVKGFKLGFKWLAWPLQIIFSLIDFIKGFASAEGSIIDKIKAGLWSVIEGFIELPVKLFGWIADWFLDLFGVKVEGGVAAKMMEGIKKGFDMLFGFIKWYYTAIWDNIIKPVIDFVWPKIKPLFSEIAEGFKALADGFVGAWNEIKPNLDRALEWGKGLLEKAGNIIGMIWDFITWPFKRLMELFSGGEKEGGPGFGDKIKDLAKSIMQSIVDIIWGILPGIARRDFVANSMEKMFGVRPTEPVEGKKETPAEEKERLEEERKREEQRRREEERRKEEERLAEQKRLAEEQAKANRINSAMITNMAATQQNVEKPAEQVPDETDNNVLGLAMMGFA